jgi:large subunit ribosomal protein L18
MNKATEKIKRMESRKRRVRKAVRGFGDRPRLSVFRSNKHIYGQLVDDIENKTLISACDLELSKKKIKKSELARETGKLLAKKALESKIEKAAFDRGGYKYHGRLKEFAEGAREGGLQF